MALAFRSDGCVLTYPCSIKIKEDLAIRFPYKYKWHLDDKPITVDEYKVYKLLNGECNENN